MKDSLLRYFFSYVIIDLLICVTCLYSQTYKNTSVSLPKGRLSIKLQCVPFCSVKVLDNRLDSSRRIYTYETGQYPLVYLYFEQSTSKEAENYINKVTAPLTKGKDTLLINIKEWGIPNYGVVMTEKNEKKKFIRRSRNSRDFIRLSADLYFQVGFKRFRKFATVKLHHFMTPTNEIDATAIRMLLDELITCTTLQNDSCAKANGLLKGRNSEWYMDSTRFIYDQGVTEFDIDEIDISANQRWARLPALGIGEEKSGMYKTFGDFRENRLIEHQVAVSLNPQDSLYYIKSNDSSDLISSSLWGIEVSGKLFFRLGDNSFVPLFRVANYFGFHVPFSLPDIYSLLSFRENSRLNYVSSAKTSNILADLGSILVTGAVENIIKNSNVKKINQESVNHNFRKCLIDMESGDIIY